MSFDNKSDAIDLLNYVEKVKIKAVAVEPSIATDRTLSMPKKALMYECRHDEVPPQPCSNYQEIDFKGAEITWVDTTK